MIDRCLVQRDTSIVTSSGGNSCHDLSLDCVKLSYLVNPNQISGLWTGINPHMPMFLDPYNDVVLILFNFHVAFKIEPLTFTRLMRGYKESFGLT